MENIITIVKRFTEDLDILKNEYAFKVNMTFSGSEKFFELFRQHLKESLSPEESNKMVTAVNLYLRSSDEVKVIKQRGSNKKGKITLKHLRSWDKLQEKLNIRRSK